MKTHGLRRIASLVLTVILSLSLAVPASAAFSDVPSTHWAAKEITRCAELGFFQGETADTFGLKKPMNRAAFATTLCRFFGWDTTASTATPYDDVPESKWYAGAVSAAYANGAVTTQSSSFRPLDPITREEMAVMLIRALGYGEIAGLAQDLSHPFTDVSTNAGYITMAYDLGLITGTTATTFSPDTAATREQTAVILMRLYDKLHAAAPAAMVIADDETASLEGYDTVAIPAGQLAAAGKRVVYSSVMKADKVKAIADAAKGAVLLHVTVKASSFAKMDAAEAAERLSKEVSAGGYDGLLLDIPGLGADQRSKLTTLARSVNSLLGSKTFYLVSEAPTRSGKPYEGYDHAALAAHADSLVLRTGAPVNTDAAIPTAPIDPVEEIYYALSSLKDIENLTLMVTSQPSVWRQKRQADPLTLQQLEQALAEGARRYYSDRFQCAYLRTENGLTVWYPEEEGAAARLQLMRLMGIERLCLSNASAVSEGVCSALEIR